MDNQKINLGNKLDVRIRRGIKYQIIYMQYAMFLLGYKNWRKIQDKEMTIYKLYLSRI